MDLNRLTMGDRVIGISGIVLFIFSFFPWLGGKIENGPFETSDTNSAWGFTLTLIAVLLGIAMVVLVALKAFDVKMPDLGGQLTWGTLLLIMGVVAFVFVLIKLIAGPEISDAAEAFGAEKTREFGIFVGLVATAGLAIGGYLRFQEDKGSTSPPPLA